MAKTVVLKLDQVKCSNDNHCLDMTSGTFTGALDFTTSTPQISGVNIATTADVAGANPKVTFAVEGSDNVWTFDPNS